MFFYCIKGANGIFNSFKGAIGIFTSLRELLVYFPAVLKVLFENVLTIFKEQLVIIQF
jgi:hypothetical protein